MKYIMISYVIFIKVQEWTMKLTNEQKLEQDLEST